MYAKLANEDAALGDGKSRLALLSLSSMRIMRKLVLVLRE